VRFCSLPSPCGSTATGKTIQAGKSRWIEGKLRIALRIVACLAGITVLWTNLIRPEGILWALVPLPGLIRWFGVGAGAIRNGGACIGASRAGRNVAASLHLRSEGRRPATSGPYRWVRNPMYTAIYIVLISFFLVSAN
jgi:protein-S-isoprenylcysteine O-methyltransferase Ste14